jgi:hypothetical protein
MHHTQVGQQPQPFRAFHFADDARIVTTAPQSHSNRHIEW